MTISGITAAGDFTIASNTCTSTLAVSATCKVGLSFTPSMKGAETGMLTVTDTSIGSPQQVTLTGAGTVVALSPSTLTFSSQIVGTTSPPQTVLLTNNGANPLTITGIAISSVAGSYKKYFSQTNTCIPTGSASGILAAGASCTIAVTFTPLSKGSFTSTMSISDDGGGSPRTISLSGVGT